MLASYARASSTGGGEPYAKLASADPSPQPTRIMTRMIVFALIRPEANRAR